MGIGGYEALAHVLENLTGEQVIQTALDSVCAAAARRISDRRQWRYARMQADPEKYLILQPRRRRSRRVHGPSHRRTDPHIILEG
jgi:hypothetical protein